MIYALIKEVMCFKINFLTSFITIWRTFNEKKIEEINHAAIKLRGKSCLKIKLPQTTFSFLDNNFHHLS